MSFLRGAVAAFGGVPEASLVLSPAMLSRLQGLVPVFQQVERETGVPWYLLAGVCWGESEFYAGAVNQSSGASGLMQIMPANIPAGADWRDPLTNVRLGAEILLSSGYKTHSLVDTLASYGGFVTWLRTGGTGGNAALDPHPYVNNVVARGTYLWTAKLTGEL